MSLDIESTSAQSLIGQAVEKFRSGEEPSAFIDLFEYMNPTVEKWLIKAGVASAEDRQDLLQEIFLRAQRKLPDLRDPNAFRGWLKTMTRNMAINHVSRKRPRALINEDLVDGDLVDRTTPPDIAVYEETRRLVRALIRKMDERDQEVLRGFYFDGLSFIELSADLNVPIGTIKSRIFKARERFEKLMREKNYV